MYIEIKSLLLVELNSGSITDQTSIRKFELVFPLVSNFVSFVS